jgi:mRNA-degrading endonuclease toxin of MazEF toxin-antitoxin module
VRATHRGPEDGLPKVCCANLHHVRTGAQARVGGLISALTESRMAQVESALLFALGLDRYARGTKRE